MKKFISLVILCILSTVIYGQNFYSEYSINEYLRNNVAKLDPIEGKYDVQRDFSTDSPFQRDFTESYVLYVVKSSIPNKFDIYTGSAKGYHFTKTDYSRLESIGETNAYRMYWGSSSARGYLKNGALEYSALIELNRKDIIEFSENPQYAYRIQLKYSFIKTYPTPSMYTEAYRKDAERKMEEAKPTNWSGTGFALLDNYIVTNFHVVENAKEIHIQGVDGDFNKKYKATLVASDKFNDLALLKVDNGTINSLSIPYSIKTITSDVGEDVFVLGYPLTSTMGDEIKLTTGVVSSKTGFQGDVSLYQISAPIQPGNSGGPLFDGKGNIIGIISAKHKGAENVGYAIKTSYLRNLIESTISTNIFPERNKVSQLNLSGKVKMVKKYIYYITCSNSDKSNDNINLSLTSPIPEHISSTRIYKKPIYEKSNDETLTVESIEIDANCTKVTFTTNNSYNGGWYQWMSISKEASIIANDERYELIRAEGIEIEPNSTYFSHKGETKTFSLYFFRIPSTATSIDFIESPTSKWKIWGIQLK